MIQYPQEKFSPINIDQHANAYSIGFWKRQQYLCTRKSLITVAAIYMLLLLTNKASAQQQPTHTVKGKVVQVSQQPVEFATVALYRAKDSSLVKGTLGDMNGDYELQQVSIGHYYVQVSSMGYKTQLSSSFHITNSTTTIDVPTVVLEKNEQQLGGVTVTGTARKPLVEQHLDKTVLNIENSILSEGNTALELLQKAPGVSVDDKGDITLKGRPGVSVMINGKLTYLSQGELMHLLRGTTSSAVSKIEVITNPPARYDAAGTGGIINIVLKKSAKQGFNGNVYTNYARSRDDRYGAGFSANYGGEKFNIYGSYNHAFRGEKEYMDNNRDFYAEEHGKGEIVQSSKLNNGTTEPLYTNNFKLGADVNLNKHNTIGFLMNGNIGTYTNNSTTHNNWYNSQQAFMYKAFSKSKNDQQWTNLTYNLNYLHKFNKHNAEISADVDYAYNDFKGDQLLHTRYINQAGGDLWTPSSRQGKIPSQTNVYVGKIDYTQTFWKDGKLEVGWKTSYVEVNNDSRFDTLLQQNWIKDQSSSNHFKYKETIHASYIQLSKDWKGWKAQVGGRGEFTNTKGHQVTIDSVNTRHYFQFFPQASLSREINSNNLVQASYSRRIERPGYDELNPYRVYRDPNLYYQGNPYLRPQLTSNIELSHVWQQKITTSIYYSITKDVVNWTISQVPNTNTSYEYAVNFKNMVNYGASISLHSNVTKWWATNYFFNLYRTSYDPGEVKATVLDGRTVFAFNLQNAFTFKKGFSAELTANYQSAAMYGIYETKPVTIISAGAQKTFLDNKFTAKLMVNDIFQTRQWRNVAKYDNIIMREHIRFDSRMVTVSLSYRFGKTTNQLRERKQGNEDIQSRVKSGG
ncbi:outer membrane receptor protein involved in Fe transport [Chitinophaga skermanii]|uniref:Outer membrane receptor protein involved in Fe transport n=1 Tax=Chitinophaga skermanii TaxID=331697 RepID=A0A327QR72_9BACT|nr:outer membrane beta-barrel family protein [Chitinophaga skermanii]RAJ04297.1 outer membrane receptor protein involved in Fe transport [Chitinophaga skermanii]